MSDEFDSEIDDEETRIVRRSGDSLPPDVDDEATKVVTRSNATAIHPEDDQTVIVKRTVTADEATRISSKRSASAGDIDDRTALAPNRVRRNTKVQTVKTTAEVKAPDVPVGTSQVFTKPAFIPREIPRTDFGTPAKKQTSAPSLSPKELSVTTRERNRAVKLGIFLVAGFVVAIVVVIAVIIFS